VTEVAVHRIAPAQTHDLRRRVLRAGVPHPEVDLAIDHGADALHLGAEVDGRLAGVVSVYDAPAPPGPGGPARQIRLMAVEPELQGRGVGRQLIDEAVADARGRGAVVIWAHARDTALGFYTAMGFRPSGPGFIHEETALPHTTVVMDLG
jgi:GNAT superfamily N-acetyltransferase